MAAQPMPATQWDAIAQAAAQGRLVRLGAIPDTCPRCGRDTAESEWSSDDQQTWLVCSCGEVVYDD